MLSRKALFAFVALWIALAVPALSYAQTPPPAAPATTPAPATPDPNKDKDTAKPDATTPQACKALPSSAVVRGTGTITENKAVSKYYDSFVQMKDGKTEYTVKLIPRDPKTCEPVRKPRSYYFSDEDREWKEVTGNAPALAQIQQGIVPTTIPTTAPSFTTAQIGGPDPFASFNTPNTPLPVPTKVGTDYIANIDNLANSGNTPNAGPAPAERPETPFTFDRDKTEKEVFTLESTKPGETPTVITNVYNPSSNQSTFTKEDLPNPEPRSAVIERIPGETNAELAARARKELGLDDKEKVIGFVYRDGVYVQAASDYTYWSSRGAANTYANDVFISADKNAYDFRTLGNGVSYADYIREYGNSPDANGEIARAMNARDVYTGETFSGRAGSFVADQEAERGLLGRTKDTVVATLWDGKPEQIDISAPMRTPSEVLQEKLEKQTKSAIEVVIPDEPEQPAPQPTPETPPETKPEKPVEVASGPTPPPAPTPTAPPAPPKEETPPAPPKEETPPAKTPTPTYSGGGVFAGLPGNFLPNVMNLFGGFVPNYGYIPASGNSAPGPTIVSPFGMQAESCVTNALRDGRSQQEADQICQVRPGATNPTIALVSNLLGSGNSNTPTTAEGSGGATGSGTNTTGTKPADVPSSVTGNTNTDAPNPGSPSGAPAQVVDASKPTPTTEKSAITNSDIFRKVVTEVEQELDDQKPKPTLLSMVGRVLAELNPLQLIGIGAPSAQAGTKLIDVETDAVRKLNAYIAYSIQKQGLTGIVDPDLYRAILSQENSDLQVNLRDGTRLGHRSSDYFGGTVPDAGYNIGQNEWMSVRGVFQNAPKQIKEYLVAKYGTALNMKVIIDGPDMKKGWRASVDHSIALLGTNCLAHRICDVRTMARAYNGSGPRAEAYANRVMAARNALLQGQRPAGKNTPTWNRLVETRGTPASAGNPGNTAPGFKGDPKPAVPTPMGSGNVQGANPQRIEPPKQAGIGKPVVCGDSIAQGIATKAGVSGDCAVEGARPQAILDRLKGLKEEDVKGKNFILSGGCSNAPKDCDKVKEMIDVLKAKGAANVVVVGVGSDAKLAGLNKQLSDMAIAGGVKFSGALTGLASDNVHPADYGDTLKAAVAQIPTETTGVPEGLYMTNGNFDTAYALGTTDKAEAELIARQQAMMDAMIANKDVPAGSKMVQNADGTFGVVGPDGEVVKGEDGKPLKFEKDELPKGKWDGDRYVIEDGRPSKPEPGPTGPSGPSGPSAPASSVPGGFPQQRPPLATAQQCPPPPQQPAASLCTVGSWSPVQQGVCTTGWQCTSSAASASAPSAQISCSPSVADAGVPVQITYACTNSTTSSGTNFSTGGAIYGSATATQVASTTTYTVTCVNLGVTASAQCTVETSKSGIVFVANPKTVSSGERSTLGWITAGMQSCVVSSPTQQDFTTKNAGQTSVNGSAETSPITSSTDFTLTCKGLSGTVKSVTTSVGIK